MQIAIYTDILPDDKNSWHSKDWLNYELINRITLSHPEHQFLIISNASFATLPFQSQNVQYISIESSGQNTFSIYRRLNWKLPSILKNNQVSLLLSLCGFLPLNGNLPSCLFVRDIFFKGKNHTGNHNEMGYLKKHFDEYLSKANRIAAISDFCKKKLVLEKHIAEEKIQVTYTGIHEDFHPLSWEEREEVKNEYTDGREYFIYAGEISKDRNIISLLKGFSVLKKRLRSNMVLILAGKQDPQYVEFPELMRTYHFRDDVNRVGFLGMDKMAKLIGSAYGLVCPSPSKCFDAAALEALHCGVPVLASGGSVTEEIAGAAGLYFDPKNPDDIGDRFCEIYKDENLRSRLIAETEGIASQFSWNKTISSLWESMMNAMN